MAIAAAGGSASVAAVVADVQMRLDELLRGDPGDPGQHRALGPRSTRRSSTAILAGEPDRARTQMEEHVDGTAALLRGFLS